MCNEGLACLAVAGDDVEHTSRQSGIAGEFREAQCGEWRELGGLEHHGATSRKRGRNFPCQHQQREIPRDDLPAHPGTGVACELNVEQLRPAGVVIEVSRDERNIEITRFADRLAVVQCLEHGQQARMFLHGARECIEMARATMSAERLPFRKRVACGFHGGIDIGVSALRDFLQQRSGGRIPDGEGVAVLCERAVDEMTEGAELMTFDPFTHRRIALGGGAVGHGLEDVGDGSHVRCEQWVTASGDDTQRRSVPSRSVRADVRCR